MVEVYGVKLPRDVEWESLQHLLVTLPSGKQERLHRFVKREDAVRGLTAEVLARSVICSRLKVRNRELEFGCNAYGKPFVKGRDGLYYNISHSGEWVVCAVSDQSVGIDVEQVGDVDLRIAGHFFSPREHADLLEKAEEDRAAYFFDLWTLKESYIKAAGMGLSLSLSSFSIRVDGRSITLETENAFQPCFFRQYPIDPAYRLSVCAQYDGFPEGVILKDFDDLCGEYVGNL